jgi:hypothetical protein
MSPLQKLVYSTSTRPPSANTDRMTTSSYLGRTLSWFRIKRALHPTRPSVFSLSMGGRNHVTLAV